jgi:hypothetical protein
LTVWDASGRRITRRDTPPRNASQRTTGQEAGRWQPRTIYDSTLPGPDGDHWFADELRNGTGQHEQITIPLTTTLPLAAGPVTLTIASSAYTAGSHELVITAGNATARRRWEGTGNWTQTVTLDTEATSATIALLPGTTADSTLIDHVTWQRPVQLQVSAAGAIFSGATGPWRYQLTGSSDDQVLYT